MPNRHRREGAVWHLRLNILSGKGMTETVHAETTSQQHPFLWPECSGTAKPACDFVSISQEHGPLFAACLQAQGQGRGLMASVTPATGSAHKLPRACWRLTTVAGRLVRRSVLSLAGSFPGCKYKSWM